MRLNKSRPGLSLAELLIGIVILATVGMGLTRIMVTQARYFDHQKKSNAARNVPAAPSIESSPICEWSRPLEG